ncbi:putative conserved exported hypothetical protein [Brochothrix thermosphacta]|uniref:WxL domain-containing protein n=1 Tax=Brochothrix thermosphacta TaxID=2756 RepID=UPI000D7B37F0|nr:WxL domain-containing protein [Brochothrix thermosphacta]SPP30544.1 putative conserved exported hypothetical protein [Brochothrix thermosphacta]
MERFNKRIASSLVVLIGLPLMTIPSVSANETTVSAPSEMIIRFLPGSTGPTAPINPINPGEKPKPDPIDPTNPGTGQSGTLTIDFLSNFKFGEQALGKKEYYAVNENPYMQVTDKRGLSNGWVLTAAVSPFESADGRSQLTGAELTLGKGNVKSLAGNISSAPIAQAVTFKNNDSFTVMKAGNGGSRGTWINVLNGKAGSNEKIKLTVPAGAKANVDYSAVMKWQLADAPAGL